MATVSLEVRGLRDLLGRFAAYQNAGLRRDRDALLLDVGRTLKDRLHDAAPVGQTTPHLADMFAVSPVRRQGSSASLSITNSKTVGKKNLNLLQLITEGTQPHDIPNAFGRGTWFVAHHPGTKANPFVARVLEEFSPASQLQRFAVKAAASIAGE